MNDPLEHDVYKPVKISHPCYFVLFASYFCGSAGFSEFILANKNARRFDFHCYFTKLNVFPHRMLCISNIALVEVYYLALFNVVNNVFNSHSNSTVS